MKNCMIAYAVLLTVTLYFFVFRCEYFALTMSIKIVQSSDVTWIMIA